jgi:hypothetical protein
MQYRCSFGVWCSRVDCVVDLHWGCSVVRRRPYLPRRLGPSPRDGPQELGVTQQLITSRTLCRAPFVGDGSRHLGSSPTG